MGTKVTETLIDAAKEMGELSQAQTGYAEHFSRSTKHLTQAAINALQKERSPTPRHPSPDLPKGEKDRLALTRLASFAGLPPLRPTIDPSPQSSTSHAQSIEGKASNTTRRTLRA